jgi:peptidoglycan hydrolase-like protein with peptidoglycan-binding domain
MKRRAAVVGAVTGGLLLVATPAFAGDNNGNGYIDYGDTGTQVKCVQRVTKYDGQSPGRIDGDFGDRTYGAVIGYQRNHGLTRDGIVGPNTGSNMQSYVRRLYDLARRTGETDLAREYSNWMSTCNPLIPG